MKRILFALLAGFAVTASPGQGAVTFNTHILGAVEAPVTITERGLGAGTIPGLTAALFQANANGTFTLVPGSETTFRTGAAAKYVEPVDVVFPGNTGTPVNLVMRVWSGPDYDTAILSGVSGQSAQFSVTPSAPPNPPANLTNLTPFTIVAPEPSTLGTGIAGLAVILAFPCFRARS